MILQSPFFEVDEFGVSAQVLEPRRWMVDPHELKMAAISYQRESKAFRVIDFANLSLMYDKAGSAFIKKHFAAAAAKSSGTQRRTYRLAVATTGEYGRFHGGETSVFSALLPPQKLRCWNT